MPDVTPITPPTDYASRINSMIAADLLQCDWGKEVWDIRLDQPERCKLDATSRVCVHREDGTEKVLKLCTAHRAFIDSQTTAREGHE